MIPLDICGQRLVNQHLTGQKLELNAPVLRRSRTVLTKALKDGKQLTRDVLHADWPVGWRRMKSLDGATTRA